MLSNQSTFEARDLAHMLAAFAEAELALEMGEVPVGCVIVDAKTNLVLARGHNETNASCNATKHAEMMALHQFQVANELPFKQREVEVYVTLEPCIMCAGALAIANVSRIVYGAKNDKFGGCGSVLDVSQAFPLEDKICKTARVQAGLGEREAIEMLQRFYLRTNEKAPAPRADGMKERLAKRQQLSHQTTSTNSSAVRKAPIFQARRSPVLSTKSMICTSQPLASMAGQEILLAGGNAVDAAVCISAVLAVIEPYSTGLGGDAFALYFDAKNAQVLGINGSGRSGKRSTLELVQQTLGDLKEIPKRHGLAVTVPGAVACWIDMLKAWGSKPLDQVLERAIHFAETGFPVSELTQVYWKLDVEAGRVDPDAAFVPPPQSAGQIMYNKDLGALLRKIASMGRAGFYEGETATAICRTVQERGGVLEEEDLRSHQSSFVLPVEMTYKYGAGEEISVFECPPNGHGMVALMALDCFQRLNGAQLPRDSAEMYNLQIECLRTSFVDAKRYVADPDFSKLDPYVMLRDEAIVQRRLARISSKPQTEEEEELGKPSNTCDTVSFQVVDEWGNSVSMVNSIYTGFGSGICPPGLGLALQNRACNFSLDPTSLNVMEGGKRPYHTIIPGMATQRGELKLSFTGMGGFAQPQNHLQFLINLLDFGDTVQEALDRPRFCLMDDGRVALEEGIPPNVASELETRFGQRVYLVSGYGRSVFGRGQIVQRDLQTGVLFGGSDGRADGCALGGI